MKKWYDVNNENFFKGKFSPGVPYIFYSSGSVASSASTTLPL